MPVSARCRDLVLMSSEVYMIIKTEDQEQLPQEVIDAIKDVP